MTMYPYGYSNEMVSFETMTDRLRQHSILPEYERRLLNWIKAQNGLIGIGSGWRAYGSDTSPASSANKSFHQDQQFNTGFFGYSAVDLVAVNPGSVHRAPRWDEVLEQGSQESVTWGLHCNVPGEPWHMQCIEQDGFDTWANAGRHEPMKNYPIPGAGPAPQPDPGDDDMAVKTILLDVRNDGVYIAGDCIKSWVNSGYTAQQLQFRVMEAQGKSPNYDHAPDPFPNGLAVTPGVAIDGYHYAIIKNADPEFFASFGPFVGPVPPGLDEYGR